MRGNVAWTGGTVLAVGLFVGFLVDRLARGSAASGTSAPTAGRPMKHPAVRGVPKTEPLPEDTDVLERYRAAAAV